MKEVINMICKKTLLEEKTAKTSRINIGVKRGREADEYVDKFKITKKPKTDDEYSQRSITKCLNSIFERNTFAANGSIKNYFKTRKSDEPTNITRTEYSDIKARKFELSSVVVKELNSFYKKNNLITEVDYHLLKCMTKTIVHKTIRL